MGTGRRRAVWKEVFLAGGTGQSCPPVSGSLTGDLLGSASSCTLPAPGASPTPPHPPHAAALESRLLTLSTLPPSPPLQLPVHLGGLCGACPPPLEPIASPRPSNRAPHRARPLPVPLPLEALPRSLGDPEGIAISQRQGGSGRVEGRPPGSKLHQSLTQARTSSSHPREANALHCLSGEHLGVCTPRREGRPTPSIPVACQLPPSGATADLGLVWLKTFRSSTLLRGLVHVLGLTLKIRHWQDPVTVTGRNPPSEQIPTLEFSSVIPR